MTRFKKVYIETTNVCNLSCNFCPKTKRELGFMNEEKFSYIVDEIKTYTNHIYLHLMGEPLLNLSLEKFLEISERAGLNVNITTNGSLIKKVKDVLLKAKSLRQINISLHSFEANNQEINFNEYLDDIINFIEEANEKTNIICSLRLWNMDAKELKASNDLNESIFSILENKLRIDFSLKEKILEKSGIKIRKNLYLNMAEKFSWPNINLVDEKEKVFCYGLRDQIGILVDGTVVPCCLDSDGNIALGNIFEEGFDNIINSERAQNIYNGFSERLAVEDLCKKCGYARRY